ncbi:UNVERIFIED_CONTAM: hypothetical protein HDU68_008332 [Siphonaria sp. JEL0065]|nr:hypothetical protein HDU68_008332 [Siphonaria sp. JEL0065]
MSSGSGFANRSGPGQQQQQQQQQTSYRGGRGGGSGNGRGGFRGGNNNSGFNNSGAGRGGYAGPTTSNNNTDVVGKGKWGNGPPPSLKGTDSRPSSALSQNAPTTSSQSQSQPPPQNEQLDRIYFLLMHMVGTKVTVVLKGNIQYEGILHTATASGDVGVSLCLARQIVDGKPGAHVVQSLVILPKDLISLSVANLEIAEVTADSGNRGGFQTDAAIGSKVGVRQRDLVQWSTDEIDNTMSLDNGLSGDKWDQFATNESLFGVETDFHEEMYTTVIDRSDPNFKRKEAEAARLAREIEAGFNNTDNVHVLEERNVITANDDVNEEDKYSSVLRKSDQPDDTYVPPGARVAAGKHSAPASAASKKPEIAVSTVKKSENYQPSLQTAPPSTKPMAVPEPVKKVRSKPPSPNRGTTPASNIVPASGSKVSSGRVSPSAGKLGTSAPSTKSEQKVSPAASNTKAATDRRDELLNKIKVPANATQSSTNPIGESFQKFQIFAEKERGKHNLHQQKKSHQPLRADLMKPKPEMFNELRAFSTSFKLPMPFPSELKEIIKKGPEDAAPSTSGGEPHAVSTSGTTQKPRPVSFANERSVSEVTAASPSSSTATSGTTTAASGEKKEFKFNLAAVEFTPTFAPSNGSPNSQNAGLPEKQGSSSIAGGVPKHPARNNSGNYNKSYQKGGYGYNQNFRPPYGQQYEDGSYPPPMDPSQQQFYYPVPNAPYPGYRPVMARPGFGPAGMPPMMGPGGVPYMMPFGVPPGALVPQMMGAPPPLGAVPMYVRPPGPGGPPPPQGPHPLQQSGKNGPPTPTATPSQIQGGNAPSLGGQIPSPNSAPAPPMMYRPPPPPHGADGYNGSPQNRPPYMVAPPGQPADPMYQAAMMGYHPQQGFYQGHPGMMVPHMVWTGDPMQMAEMQHYQGHQQIPIHMQRQHHQHQHQQQQHIQQGEEQQGGDEGVDAGVDGGEEGGENDQELDETNE